MGGLWGARSNVATTTCSIWSSLTNRRAPGQGSSLNPSNRSATNAAAIYPQSPSNSPTASRPRCVHAVSTTKDDLGP